MKKNKINSTRIATYLLFFAVAASGTMQAQTNSTTQLASPVGIGTQTANGDLHIHESQYSESVPGIEPPTREDGYLGPYVTTLRLTNQRTSTSWTDGFVIEQTDKEVALRQYERGNLYIYGHNNVGLVIDTFGRFGLGTEPVTGKKLNIGGDTQIGGKLNVNGKVTGTYGEFSQSVQISGMVRIGSGFECSADGQVKTKSLKVTLDGWSDFVFDDGYRLPTLAELEQYVKAHRHLPDIPSAAEVEQEGVDLGQMNALLLQKVEELTLYVIDLQKQIDELKNQQK